MAEIKPISINMQILVTAGAVVLHAVPERVHDWEGEVALPQLKYT